MAEIELNTRHGFDRDEMRCGVPGLGREKETQKKEREKKEREMGARR